MEEENGIKLGRLAEGVGVLRLANKILDHILKNNKHSISVEEINTIVKDFKKDLKIK